MPSAYAACTGFLASRATPFEANVFVIKAKTAVTPKAFAKLVEWVLERVLAKGGNARETADVAAFADKMADKLFVDVNVAPRAKQA
ncbi:MAG: hypothetical protein RL272_1037 [Candidatus Parcubacteria bacterium]|jgi:hypothetical protein